MAVGIYSLVSEERLRDVLGTLHAFTELPICLLGEDGAPLMTFGEAARCCELIKQEVFTRDECLETHRQAGRRAQALGEAYVFACQANLTHIAFPLQSGGALMGCILVGPFLMDAPDSTLVSGLAERYALSPSLSLELYDELGGLQIVPPPRAGQLSRLIGHLLSPLLPAEMSLLHSNQEKLRQQSRINETIQMYKSEGVSPTQSYLYQKESELMTKVRTGDIRSAKALLNDLLGYVLFSEGGRVDAVRPRAVELTTLLSRVAMDGGANADGVYALNSRFIALMNGSQTIDSLCYLLQDVVESFMSAMFGAGGDNAHIRAALSYIAENYASDLTLNRVAAHVGLTPNYLSALFKRVVGAGFREQLRRVRVEEGKRLLLTTDRPLADIAVSTGFADQSCFCKAFKRVTGVAPGAYRR